MQEKCLLLKTPDNRLFFTEEKNLQLLVEFGKTFDTEISVVKPKKEVNILDLPSLAKSLCESVSNDQAEYDVIEVKLAANIHPILQQQDIRNKKGREIHKYIQEQLLSGKEVCVDDLESLYTHLNRRTVSNYLTRSQKELQANGYNIKRIRMGTYKLDTVPGEMQSAPVT